MTEPDTRIPDDTVLDISGCAMDFICQKQWGELTPTADPKVRHCTSCEKPVTLCTSLEELAPLAREGACIAFHPKDGVVGRTTVGLPRMSGKLRAYLEGL